LAKAVTPWTRAKYIVHTQVFVITVISAQVQWQCICETYFFGACLNKKFWEEI